MSEYIWPVIELLTEEECDKVVQKADSGGWFSPGTTKSIEDDARVVERSDASYENMIWLHRKIGQVIKELVNNQHSPFNYAINDVEPLEVLKYQVGGKYDYHIDGDLNFQRPEEGDSVRKVSAIISLNEGFEGGAVEFLVQCDVGDEDPYGIGLKGHKIHLKKGEMLVFPANVWHRVTPVTKGERYSLVVWCRGPVCR